MASCIREPGGGVKPKELIEICTVDDDERDLLMMARTLEKSGEFACVGAYRCADEALDCVPKLGPQVVLMDVRMPGMSGIECARRLKSLLPGLLVIFVTGLFDAATLTEASQAGGDDYLLLNATIAVFKQPRNRRHGESGGGVALQRDRRQAPDHRGGRAQTSAQYLLQMAGRQSQ